jgi:hypothetical protein
VSPQPKLIEMLKTLWKKYIYSLQLYCLFFFLPHSLILKKIL